MYVYHQYEINRLFYNFTKNTYYHYFSSSFSFLAFLDACSTLHCVLYSVYFPLLPFTAAAGYFKPLIANFLFAAATKSKYLIILHQDELIFHLSNLLNLHYIFRHLSIEIFQQVRLLHPSSQEQDFLVNETDPILLV
jgi:hypothetical protein